MKKCAYCGNDFEPKTDRGKYCSPLCKSRYRGKVTNYRSGKIKQCEQCGKEYKSYRKSNKFCSRECAVVGRVGIRKKQLDSITNCGFCGKEINLRKSRIEKSEKCFCDQYCHAQFKKLDFQGESNPNYKNTPGKVCLGCGKEFRSHSKNRKYCSQFCKLNINKSKAIARVRSGLKAERRCLNHLSKQGYNVILSSGSRGVFDLIAVSEKEILLIQVKSNASKNIKRSFSKKLIGKLREVKVLKHECVKKQIWVWSEFEKKWHVRDIN